MQITWLVSEYDLIIRMNQPVDWSTSSVINNLAIDEIKDYENYAIIKYETYSTE